MKICPVGPEVFHDNGRTDGWTDMTMLIVAVGSLSKVGSSSGCGVDDSGKLRAWKYLSILTS